MIECEFEEGAKTNDLRHAVAEAILIKDGKIALVKRHKRLSEGGKWAIPGGYISRDEVIKEAVAREVLEETGWKAKIQQLFTIKDSPERLGEDNQNIAFVYLAEAIEEVQDVDDETDELKWFDLNNVPPKLAFDHTATVQLYKSYLKKKVELPIL